MKLPRTSHLVLLVAIALAALGANGASAGDEGVWKKAVKADDVRSYNLYLAKHPTGLHVQEAKLRVEQIEFRAIRKSCASCYRDFLSRYPSGALVDSARAGLDDAEYGALLKESSVHGCKAYLAAHGAGRHVSQVRETLAALNAEEEAKDYRALKTARSAIEAFLETYPETSHRSELVARLGRFRTEVLKAPVLVTWSALGASYLTSKTDVERAIVDNTPPGFFILSGVYDKGTNLRILKNVLFVADGMGYPRAQFGLTCTPYSLKWNAIVVVFDTTASDRAFMANGKFIIPVGSVLRVLPGSFSKIFNLECRGGGAIVKEDGLELQPPMEVTRFIE